MTRAKSNLKLNVLVTLTKTIGIKSARFLNPFRLPNRPQSQSDEMVFTNWPTFVGLDIHLILTGLRGAGLFWGVPKNGGNWAKLGDFAVFGGD